VKELIISNHEVGVDLGYLLLNSTLKFENKAYVKEQIALAKKEYQ
jgi:hypothetical protein